MRLKLDAKTIASQGLAERDEEIIWDSELPGFGLRLRRTGDVVRRSFVVQYRPAGTRNTRRVTLGTTAVFTAPQAREEARKLLAKVRLGGDPQEEKRTKRETASFKAVVDNYLAARTTELRPSSLKCAKLYLGTGSYFRA